MSALQRRVVQGGTSQPEWCKGPEARNTWMCQRYKKYPVCLYSTGKEGSAQDR